MVDNDASLEIKPPADARSFAARGLEKILASAGRLTRASFGDEVEFCAIINIRSGGCANDCRFCAQAARYKTGARRYSQFDKKDLAARIAALDRPEIAHIGLDAAGARLESDKMDALLELIAESPARLRRKLRASLGTLSPRDLRRPRDAGLRRYHHNLETCRSFYPKICSTQSWDERRATVAAALACGLEVCRGCLFGLGESVEERAALAFELKDLGVNLIPMNFLIPIPGSQLANREPPSAVDALTTLALFRHILLSASLRVRAGRETSLVGRDEEIYAATNAVMSGDFLTVRGTALERDLAVPRELGLRVKLT